MSQNLNVKQSFQMQCGPLTWIRIRHVTCFKMLHVHPKTLVRYGLLAWTRVSANSGKWFGSEWAVRVGQRLCRDSGKEPKSWVWYKSSWKFQILGGVSKTLVDLSLFLAGAVAAFWGTMGRGRSSERRAINCVFLRKWRVLGTHEIIARRSAEQLRFCGR